MGLRGKFKNSVYGSVLTHTSFAASHHEQVVCSASLAFQMQRPRTKLCGVSVDRKLSSFWLLWSRRRGSNPHGTKYHWILSPARLPVPPLRAFARSVSETTLYREIMESVLRLGALVGVSLYSQFLLCSAHEKEVHHHGSPRWLPITLAPVPTRSVIPKSKEPEPARLL